MMNMMGQQAMSYLGHPTEKVDIVLQPDFSEKYEKAKNKLIYASIFSITVCVYVVQTESSFLGIKLTGITDNRMEKTAFVVALFFFLNAGLRFFDERRALQAYKKNLDELIYSIEKSRSRLLEVVTDVERELSDHGRLSNALQDVKYKREKQLKDLLSEGVAVDYKVEVMQALNNVFEEIKRITKLNQAVLDRLENLPSLIAKFNNANPAVKSFNTLGRWRFILFDCIVPCLLFSVSCLLTFFPEVREWTLKLVP